MISEIWKPITHIGNNRYLVSNLGRVKSLCNCRGYKDRIMTGSIVLGYHCVLIYSNGKRICAKVHRLVAIAFIPNPENKKTVNHINGNKVDNRLENLEWCTHKENSIHCFRVLGVKVRNDHKYGNKNNAKSVIQISKSGEVIKEWESCAEVNRQLGIQFKNISAVCRGKRNIAGGFKWKFKIS